MNFKVSFKYIIISLIFSSVLLLSLGEVSYANSNPEVIKYEVEKDYPPFKFMHDQYLDGFDIELGNMIFNETNYHVDYSVDSWENVYSKLKKGQIDTGGLIAITENRKSEILYSKPVLDSYLAVYQRKADKKIKIEDLSKYKIGVGKGQYSEVILRDSEGIKNYKTFDTVSQAIDALSEGKIDVLFENQEVTNYLIIQKCIQPLIVPTIENLHKIEVAYGVSKSKPELVKFFNKRIDELQWSGAYEELYQKYFYSHSANYIKQKKTQIYLLMFSILFGVILILLILQFYIRFLKKKILLKNQELFKEHESLRVTLSSIGDAVIATDRNGIITFINSIAQKLTGYSEVEALKKPVKDIMNIMNEETGENLIIPFKKVIDELIIHQQNGFIKLISKGGLEFSISYSIAPISNEESVVFGVVIVFQDITDRREAQCKLAESYDELEATHEQLTAAEIELSQKYDELQQSQSALKESEERYRLAVDGSNDALWDHDLNSDKLFISYQGKEILGFNENEITTGESFIDLIHPADLERFTQSLDYYFSGKSQYFRIEYRIRTKNNEYKWILSRGKAIWDEFGKPIRMAGSHTDISDRKKSEEEIHNLAYYDTLTGLPNRTLFMDRLITSLAQSRRSRQKVAVLYLDLDNFKAINDTQGHAYGDDLIKNVAIKMRNCIRECDTVARLGGDEFVILQPQIKDLNDVSSFAERLLQAFNDPWTLSGQEFYVTASIGISIYPNDGKDSVTLLKNADAAMYKAKGIGKNNYKFYIKSMNDELVDRMEIENRLRRAVERSEFVVYYQPQIDLITGKIVAVEALVRWIDEIQGLIPPMKFIPIAEETGLILQIGEWVLKTACSQIKEWNDKGISQIIVAVNLSARQFQQSNVVDMVKKVLRETGLEPKWLELEITEAIAMKDMDNAVATMKKFKEVGISVTMDDFGTGYSSLNYLKKLPITNLKIDKSFVHDITSSKNEEAIAKVVILLSHNLNLKITAEGVETQEQLDFLKNEKCDKVQGFLFSEPVSAEETEKLLIQNKKFF